MDQLPSGLPALRVVPFPKDTNTAGDIFGGWIMSHVDVAGSIEAFQRANGRVVTVAVNSFVFKKPVFVGDVVSFFTELVKIGNTSITVDVTVFAERRSKDLGQIIKVTEARLTYVALDENRQPRPVSRSVD